ncbi:MAG: hypothetical protein IJ680_07300 [Paludibacteraceae bacterium]|nr:hypothetical protein [Paludibacteraceae bacterium]
MSHRKTTPIAFLFLFLFSVSAVAQMVSPETLAKRARRKNLTVKEWNTDAGSKTRWLDRQTTYDSEGRKTEEIEYTSYGMKWRVTYEYDETSGKVSMEVEYNDRNKPVKVRKYEYNTDGTKRKQYNYLPNGKLQSVKVFEYIFSE